MEEINTPYHTHISSKHNWYALNLKEVWRYRDLILLFTKRNFTVRYKQTILGPAWLFINPIISSLIYTVIFGKIAGISTNGVPQILFYMTGNAIWTFFSSCVTRNASTFTSNAAVFGKVYFPRLTTPVSNMLTSLAELGIQALLILFFLVYFQMNGMVQPHWLLFILIPIVLLHLGMMGLGFGIIISSLTTKYRDLTILVGFGIQLWMYVTPVVYPLTQADGGIIRTLLLLNPVTAPVEIFRLIFLGKGSIVAWSLIWSWLFTITVTIFGIMVFNKVERTFMDTV